MQLGVMNSKELQPLFDFTQKTYNDRTRTRTAEFQEAARDLDAALPRGVRALHFQRAQHAHVMHMT